MNSKQICVARDAILRNILEYTPEQLHSLTPSQLDDLRMVPKRLREAYLCPGLVDTLLQQVQVESEDALHAIQMLHMLSFLPENKHDLVTRVGIVDSLVSRCVNCGTYTYSYPPYMDSDDDDDDLYEEDVVDEEGEYLCSMLMHLGGRAEPKSHFSISLHELQRTVAFWRKVLVIWVLRSPRFALRLQGSAVTKKLLAELARMVMEMLI